jgi:1-acyl-sn-glycerol-3-phosphate acyltransferase
LNQRSVDYEECILPSGSAVNGVGASEVAQFDPRTAEHMMGWLRPVTKRWYRSEVKGLDSFPPGGALVVSNHSGGLIAVDVPIFAVDFYDRFGYQRPVYTLSHDLLFKTPAAEALRRAGYITASHANSKEALTSGGVVVVFPGGDYDAYRPTASRNTIDFRGRTGYIRAALEAGVPIVPAVSIGGQENQIYLTRGQWLAQKLRLKQLIRSDILPVSFGFPFGFSAILPVNFPFPTKVTVQVLNPIDILADFGADPDIAAVDAHVRQVMQQALDELAAKRRFPVLG